MTGPRSQIQETFKKLDYEGLGTSIMGNLGATNGGKIHQECKLLGPSFSTQKQRLRLRCARRAHREFLAPETHWMLTCNPERPDLELLVMA